MRNKFLIICAIVCSFLFIDKVSAANLVIDYDHEKMQKLDDYKYFVDELINIVDTYNTNGYAYYINFGYSLGDSYDTNVYPFTHEYANKLFHGYAIQIGIAGATNDYWSYQPYYYTNGGYIYQDVSLRGSNYQALWHETLNTTYGFQSYLTIFLGHISNEEVLNQFYDALKFYFTTGKKVGFGNKSQYAITDKPVSLNMLDNQEFMTLVYSNLPFKFEQNYTQYNDTLTINGTTYHYGDTIPTYYDTIPKTPSITTNLENTKFDDDNNVIQKKLTVDYGIYDFDKYRYEYTSNSITDKNNSDGLFWLPYLNSKPLEIMVNNNDMYYFRVLDKNTHDYITGTSVTVTGINEIIPYIVFENLNDDECILTYDKVDYQVCDLIRVYAKNIDYGSYELQYSYDFANWHEHTGIDNYKIYIRENGSIGFRLINLSTGENVDTFSYTVTRLTFPNNNNLPIIKITPNCMDNVVGGSLKVNLYNYNRDNYKFLYRTSSDKEFIETVVTQDGNNFYKSFTLSKETNLFIKITDLEGNYVTGTSFTYTGELCKKDEFDINNIDDISDFVTDDDSNSNKFFAQILNISYTSASKRLIVFVKVFLILTLVGAVLYLVGWK